MNKILKAIIPVIFCASLIMPNALPVKAETINNREIESKATNNKRIVTYFPSWGTYQAGQQNIEVSDIAWDKVTHINHGFFEITNDYKIQTTDSYADYENEGFGHGPKQDWDKYPSTGVPPGTVYGHFGEYKYYKEKYPNVKLLISVGGWTRSDKFHELAKSATHRKTLAMSMVDFMKKYPYVDGMDIDWEYPGVTRAPEDQYDRGSVGGPEDKENYTLLLKDIRETFDASGMSEKLLTVAVSAGEAKINMTEPDKYVKYLDYIGVMTYDFAGSWDDTTGHLAGLYQNPVDISRPKFNMDDAMKIFRDKYKIPTDKLLAGTPLYSRGWAGVEPGPNGDGLFQPAKGNLVGNLGDGGQFSWYDIPAMEKSPEWEKFRDPVARTLYLYNKSKKQFITYEDEQSLAERVSYVNENNYGGLIVWDASGDNIKSGHPMHKIMQDGFKNGTIIEPTFEPEDFDENRVIDILDLSAISTKYNKSKGNEGYEVKFDLNTDNIIDLYDLVRVSKKMPTTKDEGEEGGGEEVKDTYDVTHPYTFKDVVIYKGIKYESQSWWNLGITPGTNEAVWKTIK